jgi:hypothetical protein
MTGDAEVVICRVSTDNALVLTSYVRVVPGFILRRFGSRLFDWSRTSDEDIHESPGTLLPVRTGRHVGDADQCPK